MIEEKVLEDLRAKHGDLYMVETEIGPVVFRGANRVEYRQWKSARDDDAKKFAADEILSRACVVYPDAAAFEAMLDKLPALAGILQGEIIQVSGGAALSRKKL
jgi:hypothetical protein